MAAVNISYGDELQALVVSRSHIGLQVGIQRKLKINETLLGQRQSTAFPCGFSCSVCLVGNASHIDACIFECHQLGSCCAKPVTQASKNKDIKITAETEVEAHI